MRQPTARCRHSPLKKKNLSMKGSTASAGFVTSQCRMYWAPSLPGEFSSSSKFCEKASEGFCKKKTTNQCLRDRPGGSSDSDRLAISTKQFLHPHSATETFLKAHLFFLPGRIVFKTHQQQDHSADGVLCPECSFASKRRWPDFAPICLFLAENHQKKKEPVSRK